MDLPRGQLQGEISEEGKRGVGKGGLRTTLGDGSEIDDARFARGIML